MTSTYPFRTVLIMLVANFVNGCDSSSNKKETVRAPVANIPAIVKAIDAPLSECPQRVWPGAADALSDAQVLVTGLDDESAYLWQADDGATAVSTVSADLLSAQWFTSFEVGSYRSRPTLGFNTDAWFYGVDKIGNSWKHSTLPSLFHEAFHAFFQDDFYRVATSSRSQEYPIRWEPRHMRAELVQSLRYALKEQQSLSAAAFWWNQYLSNFLQEALTISGTDRIEGSATYAETIMTALADLTCRSPEEHLMNYIVEGLDKSSFSPTAADESYVLGQYAGLLLRQLSVPQWEQRVEAGETLVEVLLTDVDAVPQEADEALLSQIRSDVDAQNNRIAKLLDPGIESIEDNRNYRLVLDDLDKIGSYSTHGFYVLIENTALDEVILAMTGTYGYNVPVDIDMSTGYRLDKDTPCDMDHPIVFSLDKDVLEENYDGTYSYAADDISFADLRADFVDQDGYRWLCASK